MEETVEKVELSAEELEKVEGGKDASTANQQKAKAYLIWKGYTETQADGLVNAYLFDNYSYINNRITTATVYDNFVGLMKGTLKVYYR